MSVPVKVDEDLPTNIASLLTSDGHDARTVYAQGHSGLTDERLWPIVQSEQRMLFTADKGFANAQLYPPGTHFGIVLFRLPRESRAGYVSLGQSLLAQVKLENIVGAITVVTPAGIRIRRA